MREVCKRMLQKTFNVEMIERKKEKFKRL
jgi:hypothetical protein